MRRLLGKFFLGAALVLGLSVSAHAFLEIIDDFNVNTSSIIGDQTADNNDGFDGTGNSLVSIIDGPNIVKGSQAGWSRVIYAELDFGDSVQTEVCSFCQAGHIIADAGVTPSEGNYYFEWAGPSNDLSGGTTFMFDWSSDLDGTMWSVDFEDNAGVTTSIPGPAPLPGGFVLTSVSVPLGSFNPTPGAGFGDIERIRLNFNGVPAIDGNIDNVKIVPEPGVLALMGLGLAGLAWQARRRRAG